MKSTSSHSTNPTNNDSPDGVCKSCEGRGYYETGGMAMEDDLVERWPCEDCDGTGKSTSNSSNYSQACTCSYIGDRPLCPIHEEQPATTLTTITVRDELARTMFGLDDDDGYKDLGSDYKKEVEDVLTVVERAGLSTPLPGENSTSRELAPQQGSESTKLDDLIMWIVTSVEPRAVTAFIAAQLGTREFPTPVSAKTYAAGQRFLEKARPKLLEWKEEGKSNE